MKAPPRGRSGRRLRASTVFDEAQMARIAARAAALKRGARVVTLDVALPSPRLLWSRHNAGLQLGRGAGFRAAEGVISRRRRAGGASAYEGSSSVSWLPRLQLGRSCTV